MASLNQYDGVWEQNDKVSCVAIDMETAARVLAADKGTDPKLIQCVKTGIQVEMPVPDVSFTAEISDSAAATAGCFVLPASYVVPANSKQIFSVYLASGWVFEKWQMGINGATPTDVTGDEGIKEVALLTIPESATAVKIIAVVQTV